MKTTITSRLESIKNFILRNLTIFNILYFIFAVYVITILSLSIFGSMKFATAVLVLFATIGACIIILFLCKPVSNYNKKNLAKKQALVDKHKLVAQKQGRKPYAVGPNKEHTVFAKNQVEASSFYAEHMKHIAFKKSEPLYYITKDCKNFDMVEKL